MQNNEGKNPFLKEMEIKNVLSDIILAIALSLGMLTAAAAPADRYAAHSVLAEGRWATVKVAQTGMTLITDTQLRSLGFTDPSKVRVYGSGGAMVPEDLNDSIVDDLPLLPSVRTSRGIVFFARNHIGWTYTGNNGRPYAHTINPYSDDTFYFLSDREMDRVVRAVDMKGNATPAVTRFVDRLVHEQELEHLGESGRIYLGEDFRGTRSRTFNFDLSDRASEQVMVTVRYCAKVSGGGSRMSYKVGDTAVPRAPQDSIPGVASAYYGALSERSFQVRHTGDKLALSMEYSYSGVIFLARLDYIEVLYDRQIKLNNGQIHFYGDFSSGQAIGVAGCGESTVIYDVTDPARPAVVDFTLNGSTAVLNVASNGYREFVAFNPDQVTVTSTLGKRIANQDLHGTQAPDMLIITPEEYLQGARLIADMHAERDAMNVMVLDPQVIYNEFSNGKQDVGAWRKLLKMWHDRGAAPRYCLIMGKPSCDPKGLMNEYKSLRYTPVPIWQSLSGLTETSSYSNDNYIGMLDDTAGGTFVMENAKVYTAVGRLPVKDADEALEVARKIVDHVEKPKMGAWRNKVMLIADDNDNGVHLEQSQRAYGNMRGAGRGASCLYDRLYLDSYPLVSTATGPTYPQATSHMLGAYNEGVLLANYIGHASERGWGHELLWTWKDIQDIKNPNLMFIYAATCRFMPWDEPLVSGAEVLMLNTKGGVCGMIAATRTVYISSNGVLNGAFSSELFKNGDDGRMRPIGDVFISALNRNIGDDNRLRYALMGDPAMRLNNIDRQVRVDRINGSEVAGAGKLPEVTAGSRLSLSGSVRNPDGNVDAGFNGTVALQLYDAETVIETFGNGSEGKVIMYNDRKNRLGMVNASVKEGRWSVDMTVPLEISNNYQPALISAYAWMDDGAEASGYSESLYVYGFGDEAVADTIGPEIEYFYVNSSGFENGDVVNPNPVVFVRLSDESGINLSDAGVGHKISLRLDDGTIYDDVAQYFEPDTDGTGGSLAYGLNDLAPGFHTLTLEAWDNLNNSSRSSIEFNVRATADPGIVDVGTDCNPASSGVNFYVHIDQPNTEMKCELTVMDLNGREIWSHASTDSSGMQAVMSTYWNLTDKAGARVPRGIYLYRVRVETPQGTWSSRTSKLAVTAQ